GDENRRKIRFKLCFPNLRSAHPINPGRRRLPEPVGRTELGFSERESCDEHVHRQGTLWSFTTEVELLAGFYQYKYLLAFDDGRASIVSDPRTRYSGTVHPNAGVIVGGSRPEDNIVAPLTGGWPSSTTRVN